MYCGTLDIKLPFTTLILDRDRAKEIKAPGRKELHIYTDGSGIEGQIGAAATTMNKWGVRTTLRHQLGSTDQHTIYEAELVGIILALHIANKHKGTCKITILTDNQVTIKAFDSNMMNASSYLVPILYEAAEGNGYICSELSLKFTLFSSDSVTSYLI